MAMDNKETMEPVESRIEKLRATIEYHNRKYYVEADPEISDLEFDRLMKELEQLENQHPETITPESPTQRVGGEPIKGFRQSNHTIPMLSIDNTYNEEEVREFDARIRRWLNSGVPRYIVEQNQAFHGDGKMSTTYHPDRACRFFCRRPVPPSANYRPTATAAEGQDFMKTIFGSQNRLTTETFWYRAF